MFVVMDDEGRLIRLAEAYAAHRGLRLTTVSTYACGSGAALNRLRLGHTITNRRTARICQWFSDHWPEDAEWPADIPRPPVTPPEPEEAPAGDEAAPVGADGQVEERGA